MAYFAKKLRLKTLFEIGSEERAEGERTLLLEVGKDYCYTAFLHKQSHSISSIRLLSGDEFGMEKNLSEVFRSLADTGFESAVVCSAFPQALLFPRKKFAGGHSALALVYDLPSPLHFQDEIPEWQMVNTYSLPHSFCNLVGDSFGTVRYYHAYTPTIKIYNGYVAERQLSVHFSETSFRVLLKKDAAIHLAQTYSYKTPLDVAYYLLKICYAFELSQQEVYLILSGLVEKSSNLFAELQQYFAHIHFAQRPEISLPQTSHPHHYFTSLYNLAACVL
jgi:hypothetical protein